MVRNCSLDDGMECIPLMKYSQPEKMEIIRMILLDNHYSLTELEAPI